MEQFDGYETMANHVMNMVHRDVCACGCQRRAESGQWLHPECRRWFSRTIDDMEVIHLLTTDNQSYRICAEIPFLTLLRFHEERVTGERITAPERAARWGLILVHVVSDDESDE